MEYDCYQFRCSKGILTISRNAEREYFWDLRLEGKLIRPNYRSPDEAAFYASKSDFGDEDLDALLKGIYVPADIGLWQICGKVKSKSPQTFANN